jgi:hypothetical protein
VPLLRLVEANRRLARNSPAVATVAVAIPRDRRRLDPTGTMFLEPSGPVICVSGGT